MIDLLAAALDLPEPDRATLRTWYERHNAPYQVVTIVKRSTVAETMQVINVVNDQPYCIRLEMEKCPFGRSRTESRSPIPLGAPGERTSDYKWVVLRHGGLNLNPPQDTGLGIA